MKKVYGLVLLLVVIIATNYNMHSQTFTWSDYVDLPCNFDNEAPWSQPKEELICGLCPNDPLCCLTVVYCDRWFGVDNKNYDISIVGIYWKEQTSCCNLDLSILINSNDLYLKLLNAIHTTSEFRDKLLSSDRTVYDVSNNETGHGSWFYRYSKALCKNNNDTCIGSEKCCRYKMGIAFDETLISSKVRTISNQFYDNPTIFPNDSCPENCSLYCNQIDFSRNPKELIYNNPCDSCQGAWQYDSLVVPLIPSCPTCLYTIHYRHRKSQCNPDYYDLEVLSFYQSYMFLGCENCPSIDIQTMYGFAELATLKKFSLDYIVEGKCLDIFEFRISSCWTKRFGYLYTPCETTGCCWATYTVCNKTDSTNSLKYVRYTSGTAPDTCLFISAICYPVCSSVPPTGNLKLSEFEVEAYKPIKNEIEFILEPNPANEKVTIKLNQYLNNSKLRVNDLFGNLISDVFIDKTDNIEIETKNYRTGTYIFRIYDLEKKEIIIGKFIIIK